MMILIKYILFFISYSIFILTSCQNVIQVIDRDIPQHMISAKEIERLSNPYVDQYLEGKGYHLGKIFMFLNEDLEGDVFLTYADESSKSAPNVIRVTVDTANNKMVHVRKVGKDSKIDPGQINFNKWKIDSDEAFNITKNLFVSQVGFRFDRVNIETNNIYHHNMEVWNISLYDMEKDVEYWGTIDPYSGEVIEHGSNNK